MKKSVTNSLSRDIQKRRLMTLVGAVLLLGTAFAAVMYLRITLNAPVGGDDCVNLPRSYLESKEIGILGLLRKDFQALWDTISFSRTRFFGIPTVSSAIIESCCESLASYRYCIIGITLVVVALFGLFLYKLTGSKTFGGAYFAVVPLMFCLWSDSSTNGMYSYNAFAQSTLLAAAFAGLCMVQWAKKRRWYWALLTALSVFWGCGSYEIGYIYIFALGFAALYLHDNLRDSVITGLPALAGEAVCFSCYLINSRMAAQSGGIYDGVKVNIDVPLIMKKWVQQMSGGFPLNSLWFAGAEVGPITKGDILWSGVLGVTVAVFLYFCHKKWKARELLCLFGAGLSLLAGPAFLLAMSGKYQQGNWISWTSSYISATVESFGVALMLLVLLTALFQLLHRKSRHRWPRLLLAVIVAAVLTACGTVQRAATRERYPASANDGYYRMIHSLENGILDEVGEGDILLSSYNVWGGDSGAESLFFTRYAGRNINAAHWDGTAALPEETKADNIWYYGSYGGYGGYDLSFLARAQDESAQLYTDLTVYVDNNVVPADGYLKYYVDDGEGQTLVVCPLTELPRSEADEYNCYTVTVEDENILLPKIMIWASA